ncbi:MAG: transglutaminase family protein [Bacteroidota bacterium]
MNRCPAGQYGLFWRKDGYPIWRDKNLIAHEKTWRVFTYQDAERFAYELAKHLAVSIDNVSPAYEDVFYFSMDRRENAGKPRSR